MLTPVWLRVPEGELAVVVELVVEWVVVVVPPTLVVLVVVWVVGCDGWVVVAVPGRLVSTATSASYNHEFSLRWTYHWE